eukprot:1699546-Amphidinium_carterae.1
MTEDALQALKHIGSQGICACTVCAHAVAKWSLWLQRMLSPVAKWSYPPPWLEFQKPWWKSGKRASLLTSKPKHEGTCMQSCPLETKAPRGSRLCRAQGKH